MSEREGTNAAPPDLGQRWCIYCQRYHPHDTTAVCPVSTPESEISPINGDKGAQNVSESVRTRSSENDTEAVDAAAQVSNILLKALSGQDPEYLTVEGYVRWGLVERKILTTIHDLQADLEICRTSQRGCLEQYEKLEAENAEIAGHYETLCEVNHRLVSENERLATENIEHLQYQASDAESECMTLRAENERLREVIKNVPLSAYRSALTDCGDTDAAWECLRFAIEEWSRQALTGEQKK
jgi:hypothetical protein